MEIFTLSFQTIDFGACLLSTVRSLSVFSDDLERWIESGYACHLCAFMSHIPIELPLVFGSTANLLFQGFNFKISPRKIDS